MGAERYVRLDVCISIDVSHREDRFNLLDFRNHLARFPLSNRRECLSLKLGKLSTIVQAGDGTAPKLIINNIRCNSINRVNDRLSCIDHS